MRGRLPLYISALLLGGCATTLSLRELNGYLLRNEFAPAAEKVEKSKKGYGEKNELLYHLDRGYERLVEKLSALGARVSRAPDELRRPEPALVAV